ncbi:zinc finger CCCH domain-containing protein 24 [Phalaenopsis equestris]|uniref:zinc finger CCCH domain-containing protein 24 n=1 Tax=Phalaenopsis equestris TaxID=78828 RepID=UPI0009E62219|nr:zinc finger CCCH domain-containing protein 24 [Phalaenopsis equestris]
MEIAPEENPATAGGESEQTPPPSNAPYPLLGDDDRSCGLKRRRLEEDDDEKEVKSSVPSGEAGEVSSGEAGGLREQGVDLHSLWKTSLCSFFRRPPGGICRHGDDCRYAHGEAELRPRPDKSWDPTSERAKKLIKANDGDNVSSVTEEYEYATVDLNRLDKCLIGLPKSWALENLKSFLDGQGISYKRVKKKKGMNVGFVSFDDGEQIISAIEVLKVNPLNSKQVKVADAVCRSQKKKQTMEITMCSTRNEDDSFLASGNNAAFGSSNEEGIVAKAKAVCDVVTPLAQMSYSDQLEHKRNSLLQTLKRLTRHARKACPDAVPVPDWILKSHEIGGLPCKLEGIMESPLVDGYRNKCEFSVGCSLEGKVTVGFMLGNFREGVTAVEEPGSCPNVSRISCKYALLFQDFLQTSELPVWNRIDNIGFWRQFTVREGRCPSPVALNGSVVNEIAEVMLIVQVCSLGHEEEQIRGEFNRMAHALVHGAAACSPPLPLTAIVVQDHRGISNVAPSNCPLITLQLPKVDDGSDSGATSTAEARIHDYISNLRFSISPTAFFQVNTLAAEKLYSLAGNWAELSPDTILFDICCGTGTIGLTLAHRVGMVVGVEMNESAVSDAKRNAEINGIKNCRFICGKAEDVMGSVLKEYLDAPQHHDKAIDASADNLRTVVATKQNEGGGDVPLAARCSSNTSNDNAKFTHNLENSLPVESSVSDAAVHKFNRVVAIVDPPRVGLHPTVIKALRTHPRIRRVVYISCNPETLVANAIELCTPTADKQEKGKGNRGWRKMSNAGLARYRVKSMPSSDAFRPVRAIGIDLFPHTPHCEMVMLLER